MNKILIIQTGKLGDMVCTTPVFRAIKERYPNAAIFVAGNSLNEAVLHGNPHVTRYWDFRAMDAQHVRAENFDAAVLLNPNPGVLRILQRARVQRIVVPKVVGGYSPYMSRSYRLWSLFGTRVPHRMGSYAPREYLAMLRPLGIENDNTRKELWVTPQAQTAADALLAPFAGRQKVAIAPGAGNKIKEWPPEYFGEVATHLAAQGALIVLIGSPSDAPLAQIVARGIPKENVLDTTGKLSIEELKGLIRRMDLFVSADTGPIYIAEAFDTPTVDIVGPVDEREQPPMRPPRHVVVVPKRARPQLFVMDARSYDPAEARRQAESIKPAQVIDVIERLRAAL